MGLILSKFRKEKTTAQILEKLDNEIKGIEEYTVSTELKQKRFVGNFLVLSVGLYVISFIVFYLLFFPPTWPERITYSTPLLLFPLLIILLKRLVAWYFQRKLNKNGKKLEILRAEKKKILEVVMDKETYNVALDLLNRFGDKTNGFKPTQSQPSLSITPRPGFRPTSPNLLKPNTPTSASLQARSLIAGNQLTPSVPRRAPPYGFTVTPNNQLMQSPQMAVSTPGFRRQVTPYPIINHRQKGVLEQMVDYLIGDGPSNRFAMICKDCHGHNGMVLQEDYEYSAFRCAFCNTLNPARKLRPVAPKLPNTMNLDNKINKLELSGIVKTSESAQEESSSTSTSERDSGSDSETENTMPSAPLEENDQLENGNGDEPTKTDDVSEQSANEKSTVDKKID